MPDRPIQALVSLHDVMPDTFGRMEEILARLASCGIPAITLLVVPGLDWQPGQLERLRGLAAAGHRLAAHGWTHRARSIQGPYHRLHSLVLSRSVAEHLALGRNEIVPFMQRSIAWFGENGLPEPRLYVPPAWALGPVRRPELRSLPVPLVEILSGFIETSSGRLIPAPMVGFEADTALRAALVRAWNRWQLRRAEASGRPLRIGLHPGDFSLRLAADLQRLLSRPGLTPVDIEACISSA